MNGTKRDIDPESELREEAEDSSLPELELEEQPADALAAGTLAAGRAAIARAVKHAASTACSMARARCSMSARPRTSRSAC
jgi:hypothetical protein